MYLCKAGDAMVDLCGCVRRRLADSQFFPMNNLRKKTKENKGGKPKRQVTNRNEPGVAGRTQKFLSGIPWMRARKCGSKQVRDLSSQWQSMAHWTLCWPQKREWIYTRRLGVGGGKKEKRSGWREDTHLADWPTPSRFVEAVLQRRKNNNMWSW